MAKSRFIASAKLSVGLLVAAWLTLFAFAGPAQAAADIVTTHKDEKGWKLKVNGEDFYVKGFV